ncbi:hypothetical protein [Desulfitobacterium sp. PCE1]|uniref:hypothetical protein n=1 Tax=Desulfitobacterium sp. PCE1 TaxID=146907 RepID=UPI000379EEDA|nr:hypothetical protein [Desulfitobacterium sp. PCE1]
MSAYQLLKKAIEKRTETAESLRRKANTFYAVGELNEDEYTELIGMINALDAA